MANYKVGISNININKKCASTVVKVEGKKQVQRAMAVAERISNHSRNDFYKKRVKANEFLERL